MSVQETRFRARLLRWRRAHGPRRGWDDERDPYVILVREVMSQQTQISRVVGALPRFLERFPSLRALAEASPADVIDAWRGLGYNRRALTLQRTAVACLDRFDGTLPRELTSLQSLPGIGPYTAAAIAVFAFGARVPVVDTNVRRTVGRCLLGESDPPVSSVAEAVGEVIAGARNVRAVTQAMIDVGAMHCRARAPRCADCPLRQVCVARAAGSVAATAPKGQGAFAGSSRQLRGQIVDRLRDLPEGDTIRRLTRALGGRTTAAVDALERDGLLERDGARVRLPAGFP